MSVYQAPNGKWRVQIGSGNKRKTKVFSSKRDAERFEASQMNALEGKPTVTWQNLADAYFVGHKYKQKAETTQKSEIRASR